MNRRPKSLHEEYRQYTIEITLPNSVDDTVKVPIIAVSQWHAIEKALTKYRDIQPDREKYKHIPGRMSNVIVR